MRILMVTHYPPRLDGIAAYSQQAVRALREEGHEVEVLSPGPTAAHHHLDLVGPRGALALAKRVRDYDKVIVQFHPDMFYPLPPTSSAWAKESLALMVAFRRARNIEVVVHEIDYRIGKATTPAGQAARRLWNSVDRIYVHSEQDCVEFAKAFKVPASRIHLTEHGAHFVRHTRHARSSARRSLNIPDDVFTFLSIGFILPNKGFDRAIRAFAGLASRGARLDIVGSVRLGEPDLVAYAEDLADLANGVDGVSLHQGFVSDEMFDRWIAASDVVILPYRFVFTSGVLERALLYDRPVIATTVGAMADQAGAREGVTLVRGDADLKAAMWSLVGVQDVQSDRWPADGEDLRYRVQQEIIERAAMTRGSALRTKAKHAQAGGAARAASAAIRRMPQLQLPPAKSARPFASTFKRLVRRLTAWEIDPVVAQVNALQTAVAKAMEQAAASNLADSSSQSASVTGEMPGHNSATPTRGVRGDGLPTAAQADGLGKTGEYSDSTALTPQSAGLPDPAKTDRTATGTPSARERA